MAFSERHDKSLAVEKILIIGSGGREHALCWVLKKAQPSRHIFCAPGNPGTAQCATNLPLAVDNLSGLKEFALQEKIDFVIVGPEYPLTLGIVDLFREHGITVFGPTKAAARLEGSKAFAKEVMEAAGVPTARYKVFSTKEGTIDYANSIVADGSKVVLKADGLAAGKGVVICADKNEIADAAEFIFGDLKNASIVVEEFLDGVEASFIVATDGERVVPLAASHDYKRLKDGQTGPNTGGMGTVSPSSHLSEAQEAWAIEHVIQPVLREMKKRGTPFTGFLYAGLMISPKGEINVIEFNCRLGDPETQVILRRCDFDFGVMLRALLENTAIPKLAWLPQTGLCVVLASAGYPETPQLGDKIEGIEFSQMQPDIAVFHAGTKLDAQGKLVTNGGRVLNVTSLGSDLDDARRKTYRGVDLIQFRGRQARRDIGL